MTLWWCTRVTILCCLSCLVLIISDFLCHSLSLYFILFMRLKSLFLMFLVIGSILMLVMSVLYLFQDLIGVINLWLAALLWDIDFWIKNLDGLMLGGSLGWFQFRIAILLPSLALWLLCKFYVGIILNDLGNIIVFCCSKKMFY